MVDENHMCHLNYQFSLPHAVDIKLVTAMNHSILGIFQKFKMY
jgi:hypothetical protein